MKIGKLIAYTFLFASLAFFSFATGRIFRVDNEVKTNINKVSNNTYVSKFDISKIDLNNVEEELTKIEEELIGQIITININDKNYEYTLKEIGVRIDKESLKKQIKDYQESIDYHDSYNSVTKNQYDKKVFEYNYIIDEEVLNNFIETIAINTKIIAKKGNLVMGEDRVLRYLNEIVGFDLSKEESKNIIKENFKEKEFSNNINLVGKTSYEEDYYKTIDTKIATVTTTFNPNVSRRINIEVAAAFIDKKIIHPGEIFSFYNFAGPFTRREYAYYLGVRGNGVCQVASTLYNVQLLSGLETIERYNHGIKQPYVEGGLDATVASGIDFVTDYKFRNNKNYPIYISAYTNNGTLTIEFWSNKNANNGIVYKTESVKFGYLAYSAYRVGYKDGAEVSREFLGNSYYTYEQK